MEYIQLTKDFQTEISVTNIDKIKPPYVHFRRQSKEYIFYYILEGEMFLKEGNIAYHLEENDFIFLDPSHVHVGMQTSTCQFLYVHFVSKTGQIWVKQEIDHTDKYIPKYYHLENLSCIISCRELIQQFVTVFHSNEVFSKEMTENMFQLLLLTLSKEYVKNQYEKTISVKGKAKQIIPELITYLHQEYATAITSEVIQEQYHYNFDYINRQFKKWTGSTIFHYLNDIRIQHAKQLLTTELYTMEEIAERTGFHDIYYFSRVFKQYTGNTPGKYRKL